MTWPPNRQPSPDTRRGFGFSLLILALLAASAEKSFPRNILPKLSRRPSTILIKDTQRTDAVPATADGKMYVILLTFLMTLSKGQQVLQLRFIFDVSENPHMFCFFDVSAMDASSPIR